MCLFIVQNKIKRKQKKINIKSEKLNKRKEKLLVFIAFHNTDGLSLVTNVYNNLPVAAIYLLSLESSYMKFCGN